jgi:hypothetical protein
MADDKKKAPKAEKTQKADKGAGEKKEKRAKGEGAADSGPRTKGRPAALGKKQRLRVHYEDKVRPALMERFGYKSVMQTPRFEKIVINMGVGDAITDQKLMDAAVNELTQISGQRPSVRRARKSIANFKLREKQPIGCMVTLRGARMYEFFDRLVNVAVPRIPRLPRTQSALVRRARQLLDGTDRADHLSRDQHRQGREDPRNGRHHRNDGAVGRGGA